MQKIKKLFFLTLLVSLSYTLSITTVSLLSQPALTSLTGSIHGGTRLYIEGLGFSPIMSQNTITVGDYPCKLLDGATATSIVCQTSAPGQYKQYWNLDITVIVSGMGAVVAPLKFSYTFGATPYLFSVTPAVSYGGAGKKLYLYGYHRIFNLGADKDQGDVIGIYIGDSMCSRFGLMQDQILANSPAFVQCFHENQKAGKYNITQHVYPGKSHAYQLMLKADFDNSQKFHFIVLPMVNSTTKSGSINGQDIVIKGTGFSPDITQIKVEVDGVNCQVTQATLSQINCRLQKKETQPTTKLTSNAGTPINQYESGSGFFYQRYNISTLSPRNIAKFKQQLDANTMDQTKLLQSGIKGEIRSQNTYGSNIGQVFKGYFIPPVDGVYRFRGYAQNSFSVYLSDQAYGSTTTMTTPIISSTYGQNVNVYPNYYQTDNPLSQSANITLVKGNRYYMQVYHMTTSSSSAFSVSVEVPNIDTNVERWQTYQVQTITTSIVEDPEIMLFTSKGVMSGTLKLKHVVFDASTNTYREQNCSIPYNAGSNEFCNCLKNFDFYSPYGLTCSLVMYDGDFLVTTNVSMALKFQHTVTIANFRPATIKSKTLTPTYSSAGGSFTAVTLQQHSPLMSGTFTLQMGGLPIKIYNSTTRSYSTTQIPFNVDQGTLLNAFRQFNGMKLAQVERTGNVNIAGRWVIYFVGYNDDIPTLVVSGAGLAGGKTGTTPQINVAVRRQFTTNLFVDPIDYRFMSTYANKPNFRVTVNNVPSVCNGDCSYTFLTSVPVVTSSQIVSVNKLELVINNPTSTNIVLSDLTIILDGQKCINLVGTLNNFTCDLPKNTDNTPILSAGNHYPVVTVKNIGTINIDMTVVNPIISTFDLTSSTPSTSGNNGGYPITIIGTGFPSQPSLITFTLCSQTATIQSLSNIQAVIIAPNCGSTIGSQNIVGTYKTNTDTLAFTLNSPSSPFEINMISPFTWSPVMKGVIEITGTGFGSNLNNIQVYLTNSSGNVYQMKVLSVTPTLIKAGIPGGLTGKYKVNVIQTGLGFAVANPTTANDFIYEVVITGISPKSGSIFGGTLLTITGRNFAPDALDTMVTIGNQLNQLCKIESITSSQIKCRTPTKDFYYSVGQKLIVLVNSKLLHDSSCQTGYTCEYQYIADTSSPTLTSLSSTSFTGSGTLTLNGSGLYNPSNGTCSVSLTNQITRKITVYTPSTCLQTQLAINVPVLESGLYWVRARADPIGESNPMTITVNLNINNITPGQLSVNGGRITIAGFGFPQTWPNKHYNKMSLSTGGNNVQLNIVEMTTSKIVLQIPKGFNTKSYSFSLSNPLKVTKSTSFSQLDTSTPSVSLTSPTTAILSNTDTTLNLNRTNLISTTPQRIQLFSVSNPNYIYPITSWTYSSSIINFSVTLSSGKYGFRLYDDILGYYKCISMLDVISDATTYTMSNQQVSFNGDTVTITGSNIGLGSTINVNGLIGTVKSQSGSNTIFNVPKLVTPQSQTAFKLIKNQTLKLNQKTLFGDYAQFSKAFDNDYSTFYDSNNPSCSIGVDIGQGLGVQLTRIRYFTNVKWSVASQYIKGGIFQGSNDNSIWQQIGQIDQTVHAGWNSILISSTKVYRYVKFSHTAQSRCNLAEFQITGYTMSQVGVLDVNSYNSSVIFSDGLNTKTFNNVLQFRSDKTPVVKTVSPKNGDVYGGYNITITGDYLNIDTPTVNIDGIQCIVQTSTSTSIICLVGARLQLPKKVTFDVNIGNKPAILQTRFKYVMRWSDPRTWGTDLPPVDKDLVYVPEGMHLLVDQSTPVLEGIIVQNGTIQFADQSDMTIHAGFITINRGEFIAGTQTNNYLHQLTFILYGNYYGPQQPMFGNKGIGCLQCTFLMHGKKRTPTWTQLQYTVNIGDNQLTVQNNVDWQVGQTIVIASTSYNHNQAEQRIITAINGKVITVNKPFQFIHYAGIQNYGSEILQMRAQVGLLTRNIKVMGDDKSIAMDYGSHLMLAGSAQNGLVGKIGYTEFTKCGQPQIVGRYCHHFHMNGDVPESYSIGNSVHHSMARILTLHGVHFLYVAWNVGYRVKGHNFFIEDGVETNNILEYNLAISSLAVNNMMQTDMSVASFWVTNPSNHLRYNHAAGSDFYGFWYEIKQRPDGPSATEDVCPIGNPLGQAHDNVAHSNVRFGLRIFKLYSRENPCLPIRDDKLQDPWSQNPSIQSRFSNYVLYKNGQAGLLAEQTGHTVFENFIIAESIMAGMQFYKNNFTRQDVKAINMTIIGRSVANPPPSDSLLNGCKGVILPRTGGLYLQNIKFYQFTSGMTVWQSCSKCDQVLLYTNFGAYYWARQISYNNINGSYYFMKGLKRQVFYDEDGTLTSTVFNGATLTRATLTFGFPHLLQNSACKSPTTPSKWDNAAVCDNTVHLRQVMFANLVQKQVFKGISIRARQLATITQKTLATQTIFTSVFSLQKDKQPKKQNKWTYSLPYIVGQIYDIWWGSRIDWKHISMVTSHLYEDTLPATIFKFAYIDNRELYEIGPQRGGVLPNSSQYKTGLTFTDGYLDKNTCKNGDYYHDNSKSIREMHLCASGKDKWPFQYTDVTGIYCRYLCPAPPGSCEKQTFVRNWNNATQWPQARLPQAGQNVTIPCEWTVKLNMNPQVMDYFEVNGDIIIEDSMDLTITANNVWIKGGSIKAGTSAIPHTKSLIFQLNGLQNDTGFTVDPLLTGNKMFVVTGKLQLFGSPPATVQTKLTAFANKGATSITVSSASGWKVGDQIGIAPSFSGQKQFQKVKITAINGNTITFTPALLFNHYGAANPTIVKSYGTLDMRTSVAHLTRNIKFTTGPSNDWGFSFIQYGYYDIVENKTVIRTGKVQLSGVQFIKGGQYDTEQAALQLLNILKQTNHTLITKSSFHSCQDFCMKIQKAHDVEIVNNVFFNARKYHVRALQMTKFDFKTNLMIGVTKRPNMAWKQLIACFGSYKAVNAQTDLINVSGNTCQGSQGNGFIFPHVQCNDQDIYPFAGNTAGSTDIAFILARGIGNCLAVKGFYAYASAIGVMHNPPNAITTKFKNFIMADNQRSITIRIGGSSQQKTGYLQDSYITAISRPSCVQCYGQTATLCSNNHGIRMLTTGRNGEQLPDKFGHGYDVVCKQQTIDGKTFIYNTEFNNFRSTYSTLPQCNQNVAFRPHSGASDITGSHHLFNSNCTDCQQTAWAYFDKPSVKDLGWFGGCGSIFCTGMNNYIIHDHSGGFLPDKGILLANNSWIGDNTASCTKISQINGHYCTDEDFGVLEYESIAPDFNTRIMWPVYLTPDDKNWTTQTNGWREWHWNGGQPLNNRLGRFVSVVKLHNIYNMTFTSMPPEDMTFKIQKRLPTGNSSDYVVVKLYYPKPNSIRVQVGGQTIKPISLLDNNGQSSLNTSLCGSNKFFYQNYTVHFVVTGDAACKVRVTLSNSIQLTARFAMNINDFFNKDGQTRFINRMAALLNIKDYSRIKIVGVYAGSVVITTYVDEPATPIEDSTTVDPKAGAQTMLDLQNQFNQKLASGQVSSEFAQESGFGAIESFTVKSIQVRPDDAVNSDNLANTNAMIIGIVLGATFIVCITIIGSVCYMRKRAKIGQSENHIEVPMGTQQHKQLGEKGFSHENFSVVDLKHYKKDSY